MDDAWMDRGKCRAEVKAGNAERDWWFPGFPAQRHVLAKAKAICDACPVKVECHDWAVANRMVGVWGGVAFGPRVHRELNRLCPVCKTPYLVPPTPGRRPETCSPACGKERHLQQQAAADEARGVPVGTLKDRGHGTRVRYAKGCRCRACRRASREYTAEYRARQKSA